MKILKQIENETKKINSNIYSFSFSSDEMDYKSMLIGFNKNLYSLFNSHYMNLNISESIKNLFMGEIVNETENQSALHHVYRDLYAGKPNNFLPEELLNRWTEKYPIKISDEQVYINSFFTERLDVKFNVENKLNQLSIKDAKKKIDDIKSGISIYKTALIEFYNKRNSERHIYKEFKPSKLDLNDLNENLLSFEQFRELTKFNTKVAIFDDNSFLDYMKLFSILEVKFHKDIFILLSFFSHK